MLNRCSQLKHLEKDVLAAVNIIIECYKQGGKVLVCGNGGSSSDADHIVGELMKSFEENRQLNPELKQKMKTISSDRGIILAERLQQGIPAVSLSAHNALITAIANDINGEMIFAQQVIGLGNKGDVLIALSTSGNSQNVVDALIVAKAKEMQTIGFTGETGGSMKKYCDVLLTVNEKRTTFVQELHLPLYHTICLMVEKEVF